MPLGSPRSESKKGCRWPSGNRHQRSQPEDLQDSGQAAETRPGLPPALDPGSPAHPAQQQFRPRLLRSERCGPADALGKRPNCVRPTGSIPGNRHRRHSHPPKRRFPEAPPGLGASSLPHTPSRDGWLEIGFDRASYRSWPAKSKDRGLLCRHRLQPGHHRRPKGFDLQSQGPPDPA